MNPGRRMLILLATLFMAPLAVSFYLYYGQSSLQPSKRVNHGDLLQPARALPPLVLPLASGGATPADFLRHKWTLLFYGAGACETRCRQALYDTRQVRIALDRDMVRIQRVFLATGACCDMNFLQVEHADLITLRADAAAEPLLAQLPLEHAAALAAGRVYLIDPLSNLVLSYAPDAPPKGMLEDLKRLLKLSQIG